jgi:GNAT superfamily N-acetyltransferase
VERRVNPTASSALDLHEATLGDQELRDVAGLLKRCFPKAHHLTTEFLAWQYMQSPEGHSQCYHARAGDQLVGHAAFSPMSARILGTGERGILVHNVATHPDHMGRGIFTELLGAGIEAARAAGCGFAIAVPNRQSVRILLDRHGFGTPGALEARLGTGPMPEPADEPARGFERLWSADALAWRLARPGARYGLAPGDTAQPTSPARLLVVTDTLGIRAELACVARDLLAPEPSAATAPGSRLARLRELRPSRMPLQLAIGLDATRRWKGRAYFDLPMRLRPAPLHVLLR